VPASNEKHGGSYISQERNAKTPLEINWELFIKMKLHAALVAFVASREINLKLTVDIYQWHWKLNNSAFRTTMRTQCSTRQHPITSMTTTSTTSTSKLKKPVDRSELRWSMIVDRAWSVTLKESPVRKHSRTVSMRRNSFIAATTTATNQTTSAMSVWWLSDETTTGHSSTFDARKKKPASGIRNRTHLNAENMEKKIVRFQSF